MAQVNQMTKSQKGGVAMIENDVGNAIHALVARNCNGGQCRVVLEGGINRDDSLNATGDQ
jgi:hypothetical protein